MFPEDVEFLFDRVRVSTPVRIVDVPIKMGWDGDALVVEVHPLLEVAQRLPDETEEHLEALDADVDMPEVESVSKDPLTHVTEQFIAVTRVRPGLLDWGMTEDDCRYCQRYSRSRWCGHKKRRDKRGV